MNNKYAEGLPRKRYYGGCEFVDVAEELALERVGQAVRRRARQRAGALRARRRTSPPTSPVAEPGEHAARDEPRPRRASDPRPRGLVLGQAVQGGPVRRRVRGPAASTTTRSQRSRASIARSSSSRARSAYPRVIDFERFAADRARGRARCSSWTWRTSPGWSRPGSIPARCRTPTSSPAPRTRRCAARAAGFVLARRRTREKLDKAVFPALQGGPLMHVIAAKAVCFGEALDRRLPRLPAARSSRTPRRSAAALVGARLRPRLGRHRQPSSCWWISSAAA